MKFLIALFTAVCLFSSVAIAGWIVSVEPDHARQGDKLWVTITGSATSFGQGSSTMVWFQQGSSTINASGLNIKSPVVMDAYMDIWLSTHMGAWDVCTRVDWQAPVCAYGAFSVLKGYVCGDMDGSGEINISDVIYLVTYIFAGGGIPLDTYYGDVDCDGRVNLSDAVYMVAYIFGSGAAPCAGC